MEAVCFVQMLVLAVSCLGLHQQHAPSFSRFQQTASRCFLFLAWKIGTITEPLVDQERNSSYALLKCENSGLQCKFQPNILIAIRCLLAHFGKDSRAPLLFNLQYKQYTDSDENNTLFFFPQGYLERQVMYRIILGVNSQMNWLCLQKFIRCYNILHFHVDKYRRVTAFSGRLGVLPLSIPILNLIQLSQSSKQAMSYSSS